MSIDTRIGSMFTHTSNAYDKITEKGGTIPERKNLENLADAIDSISTGGGGGGTDGYLIEVIDFRGNVYYSQRHQTGDVVELPSASDMALEGMVFQEFSAPVQITNNTITVEDFDLTIGGIYTTASGKTEIDIELTTVTGLSVTLNMNGNKDWGDGSAQDTLTSHTYAQAGKYTIKCDGTTITSSNVSGMFGQWSDSSGNWYVKNIRFNNISSIPNFSMQYCYSLTNVSLPKGLTSISNYAFQYCYSLTNVNLPSEVTNAGSYVFYNCFSLRTIIISNVLSDIGASMFYQCRSLANISLPSVLTSIGSQAFSNCQSLTNIKIPNNVTSLGVNAFFNCTALKNIKLSSQLTEIGNQTFSQCYPLTKITMPSGITNLGSKAFHYCWVMTKYDFSSSQSVPTLSNIDAFTNINKTCKIVVPDSLYTSWIGASNWSNFANYIVKASEYVE